MVFSCLGLRKKRPRGQLSSSPDFEVGREARLSPPTLWGSQTGGLRGFPPQFCLPASRIPYSGLLNQKGCFDPEYQASPPPGHPYRGGRFPVPLPPPPSANHKSSTSLLLVTGQEAGQTVPPSESDSPLPN